MDEHPELWQPLKSFVKMHTSYYKIFKQAVDLMFYGQGPLPVYCRHYLAAMAACRHQCQYLIGVHKNEFLRFNGPPEWLVGLKRASQRLRDLDYVNRHLAHRPWLLDVSHLQKLCAWPNAWSLSEIVQGAMILSHTHALCSFVNGCGFNNDAPVTSFQLPQPITDLEADLKANPPADYPLSLKPVKQVLKVSNSIIVTAGNGCRKPIIKKHEPAGPVKDVKTAIIKFTSNGRRASPFRPRTSHSIISRENKCRSAPDSDESQNGFETNDSAKSLTKCKSLSGDEFKSEDNVQKLISCMQALTETEADHPRSEEDNLKHFLAIKQQDAVADIPVNPLMDFGKDIDDVFGQRDTKPTTPFALYSEDPGYTYSEFSRKINGLTPPTFTIHEFSWEDQGFSIVDEFYEQMGNVVDKKFIVIQDLTYHTMGGRKNVDTTKYRMAIWHYIQCLFGIRHDDYDYSEINKLLSRPMKAYIKTSCCYPERMNQELRDSVMVDFLVSEKIHVNLLIFEARFQAQLLYFLRTIAGSLNRS